MDTARQNPGDTHQDEIGSSIVARIKQELKEPFLTLLASSEYANKTEFLNRIKTAQNALSQFELSLQDQLVADIEVPQLPSQNISILQVSAPAQMTTPLPEPEKNQPEAMIVPVVAQQSSAQEQATNITQSEKLPQLPVTQTEAPSSTSGSQEPLTIAPPQQQSPFQTPPAVISTTEVPTSVQPLEAPQALPQQLPETEEHPISTESTPVNAATAIMPADQGGAGAASVGLTTLPQMPS